MKNIIVIKLNLLYLIDDRRSRYEISPFCVKSDFGGFYIGVLPLHLRAVHEVTESVESLRLPVEQIVLLVHRSAVSVVLDTQGLKVMHCSGHQVTCKEMNLCFLLRVMWHRCDYNRGEDHINTVVLLADCLKTAAFKIELSFFFSFLMTKINYLKNLYNLVRNFISKSAASSVCNWYENFKVFSRYSHLV